MKNGKVKPSCKIENQKKCENPWKSKGFVIYHNNSKRVILERSEESRLELVHVLPF